MKQRRDLLHGKSEALMWERWRKGESLQQIASCLIETTHHTTHSGGDGGIRRRNVRRSRLALSWLNVKNIACSGIRSLDPFR